MGLVSIIISLPITIGLIVWLKKCKCGEPFPKGVVVKLVLSGVVCVVVVTVFTLAAGLSVLLIRMGPDAVSTLMHVRTKEEADAVAASIQAAEVSGFPGTFLHTMLTVALIEEFFRYVILRLMVRGKSYVVTRLDWAVCGGLVGCGFQLLEDITYSSAGVATAIFRSITPFHFLFGVIMGYLIGRGAEEKKGWYHLLALAIPVLLHTLFDSLVKSLNEADIYVLLLLGTAFLMIALAVYVIVRMNRARKKIQAEEAKKREAAG